MKSEELNGYVVLLWEATHLNSVNGPFETRSEAEQWSAKQNGDFDHKDVLPLWKPTPGPGTA